MNKKNKTLRWHDTNIVVELFNVEENEYTIPIIIDINHITLGTLLGSESACQISSPKNNFYYLGFKDKNPSIDCIIHECWHLFFNWLADIDSLQPNYRNLSGELYTIEFTELVEKIKNIIDNISNSY